MAVRSLPRPELAYEKAVRSEFPRVVQMLRDLLGAPLVAYVGGVKETRAVHQWADPHDERTPSAATQRRLRSALQVTLMISDADGPEIAASWLQGLNPQLDDRSPARLLREDDLDEVGPELVGAARAFLVGG